MKYLFIPVLCCLLSNIFAQVELKEAHHFSEKAQCYLCKQEAKKHYKHVRKNSNLSTLATEGVSGSIDDWEALDLYYCCSSSNNRRKDNAALKIYSIGNNIRLDKKKKS